MACNYIDFQSTDASKSFSSIITYCISMPSGLCADVSVVIAGIASLVSAAGIDRLLWCRYRCRVDLWLLKCVRWSSRLCW